MRRTCFRALAPDAAADLIQGAPVVERSFLLGHPNPWVQAEVSALLASKEDEAGGLNESSFRTA
jgi:hypothetical protein